MVKLNLFLYVSYKFDYLVSNLYFSVKYIAAYLLLVAAGNTTPSSADVSKVLKAVGIEVEDEKLKTLISEVEGKSAEELIAEGNVKLSSVPTGGAAAGGAAATEGGAEEAAEEEKAESEAEESDDDMGMLLLLKKIQFYNWPATTNIFFIGFGLFD